MRERSVVLCLLFVCRMAAQETAQLSGFIWDSSDALVPTASVSAVNEETGFRRATDSGGGGSYKFGYLNPGHYKITVRKDGFRTLVQFGIKLDAAQSARLDFHLQLGDVQEVVTVTGGPVLLNAQDASVSTLVGRNWIEQLPLNGRGLLTLMELAPGAVITPASTGEAGQFSINGQRPNMNFFTVDGVSANTGVSGGGLPAQMSGGSLPNMTAFGSLHTLSSIEDLDEFRIQTSTATPELGRSPGGQVELSSRSGSNEFHGAVFDAARNAALDANDWFANRQGAGRPPIHFQDFGGTLGGPIHKDRTFVFLSYEGMQLTQPYNWQAVVPSLAARQTAPFFVQPLLKAFPAPNGPDLGGGSAQYNGSSSRPSSFDGGSVRVDHALTSRVLLFGRYTQTPSSADFQQLQNNSVQIDSNSITAGVNAVLSPALTDELRFNTTNTSAGSVWRSADGKPVLTCYTDVLQGGANAPCTSFYRFAVNGVGQLVAGTDATNQQRQWDASNSTEWRRGAHDFRFGVDFRRLAAERNGPLTSINVIAASMQDVLNGVFTINEAQTLQRTAQVDSLSLYAMDTWRITPRFSLTYGMRWDIDPPPVVPVPPASSVLPPAPGPAQYVDIWRMSYTNLAPHAGGAYRITTDGRTVLRAGIGLYYDPNFSVAMDGINGTPYNTWRFNSLAPTAPSQTSALVTYGFAKDLRIPSTLEWNVTVEHALTANDAISAAYIGARGRDLLRREIGPQSSLINQLVLATNHGDSNYYALQLQYRRRLTRGLQGLASYAWSHSIDNGSADSAVYWAPSAAFAAADRASSNFDVRQTFTAAFSLALPQRWSLDGMFRARTGFPIDVLDAESAFGLAFANAFRPSLIPGAPLWLNDPNAPAGRRLNPAAFKGQDLVQGNLGRNTISGFGMSQLDVALRRSFALTEKCSLEVRAESFNLVNHANFADPLPFLASPLFGQSPSMLNAMLGSGSPSTGLSPAFQLGGPRAVQLVARFQF